MTSMSSKKILLVGGGGFIGAALARSLVDQGWNVQILARHPVSADLADMQAHVGDMADPGVLARLLPGCGTVVHLASVTTPGSSAHAPTREADNLLPTLALIEALQEWPETRLIYFSSGGTLYGNPAQLPVSENAPLQPRSYHGAAKAAQEMFLEVLRACGRPVTVLRPANAYGPGQELQAGFGLVRTVLERLRCGQPIEVWGDGSAMRDYLFIEDLVTACTLLIDRPADSSTYNVGSGIGVSVSELIRLAGEATRVQPKVIYHPARQADVSRVVLDTSRIQALGWLPTVPLDSGLRLTWQWLSGMAA